MHERRLDPMSVNAFPGINPDLFGHRVWCHQEERVGLSEEGGGGTVVIHAHVPPDVARGWIEGLLSRKCPGRGTLDGIRTDFTFRSVADIFDLRLPKTGMVYGNLEVRVLGPEFDESKSGAWGVTIIGRRKAHEPIGDSAVAVFN